MSTNNLSYLDFMNDIYDVSAACSTKTYIWGGFTIDIFEGRFLREHSDLDGFVLNMPRVLNEMVKRYEQKGYQTNYLNEIDMLQVKKGDVHASFNILEINDDVALWKHIGDQGAVYFQQAGLMVPQGVFMMPKFIHQE
jgi:hypothetical protein